MTIFCNSCGEPIANEKASFCPNCGKSMLRESSEHFDSDAKEWKSGPNPANQKYYDETALRHELTKNFGNPFGVHGPRKVNNVTTLRLSKNQTKSPFLAVLLSLIFIGAGQLYNGKFLKGLIFMFAANFGFFFFLLPGIAIWLWCLRDAYNESKKINQKELPYAEPNIQEIIIFIFFSPMFFFMRIFAGLFFLVLIFTAI